MSDTGRKGLGEQVSEKVTPDSQKSTLDQAKESVTGAGDRVASAVQPSTSRSPFMKMMQLLTPLSGDQKSASQQAGDTLRGGSDDASNQGKGILGQAQETLSGAAQSVSDTLSVRLRAQPFTLRQLANIVDRATRNRRHHTQHPHDRHDRLHLLMMDHQGRTIEALDNCCIIP